MNNISEFDVFCGTVEYIAVDISRHLISASDDFVARRIVFGDTVRLVCEGIVDILANQRHMMTKEVVLGRWIDRFEANRAHRLSSDDHRYANELHTNLTSVVKKARFPVEYVGMIFEILYGRVPDHDLDGSLVLRSSTKRKDNGVFYTPPEVVRLVTRLTVKPLIRGIDDPDQLLRLRVLDPAMGTGFFLLETLRLLSSRLVKLSDQKGKISLPEARRLIAQNCLYGVDIDQSTTEISKALLWLEIGDATLPREFLDNHFRTGDALLSLPIERLEYECQKFGLNSDYVKDTQTTDQTVHHSINQLHNEIIHQYFSRYKHTSRGRSSTFEPVCWEASFPDVFLDNNGKRKIDSGFHVILSNPPWGKIKPDLKEFFAHLDDRVSHYQGTALRTYILGEAQVTKVPSIQELWEQYTRDVQQYARLLKDINVYSAQNVSVKDRSTGGDDDLYKYFMERAFHLLAKTGRMGMVIPSGFQRSQGATGIRHLYFQNGAFEQFLEFENRKRLFPIHGMFRFLLAVYQRGPRRGIRRALFGLSTVSEASATRNSSSSNVSLPWHFLRRIGGDILAVPEVRSKLDQKLFEKLHSEHPRLGERLTNEWNVSFVRELDMTNDSHAFRDKLQLMRLGCRQGGDGLWATPHGERYLPVYEGRMVHQFDYAAKAYQNGQGRTAQWLPLPLAQKEIIPHYFVAESYLTESERRQNSPRAGFCDVTGHANERTVLTALIPGRCVCGNKVPTCTFDTNNPFIHLIWIAIANSFVIDWLVRRRISTTLNFFHWHQIPFPRVKADSNLGIELAKAAAQLSYFPISLDTTCDWLGTDNCEKLLGTKESISLGERAQLRANIDAIVAGLFNLTIDEYANILVDFPLLDRYQPALPISESQIENPISKHEPRSTVTRDKALLAFCRLQGQRTLDIANRSFGAAGSITNLERRVQLAEMYGAVAYVASEGAGSIIAETITQA